MACEPATVLIPAVAHCRYGAALCRTSLTGQTSRTNFMCRVTHLQHSRNSRLPNDAYAAVKKNLPKAKQYLFCLFQELATCTCSMIGNPSTFLELGTRARRKPRLLLRLPGLLLFRFAERQFFALLFQLPPRFTRFEPSDQVP